MNRLVTEYDILDAAIDAIHRETGLCLDVVGREIKEGDRRIDAIIRMPDKGVKLVAEVKKWASHANPGAVINRIKQVAGPGKGLLVADYINPNMGETLKKVDIQFMDMAGNAYINLPPVYIYIKGNRPAQNNPNKGKTGTAFQPSGMKVVFAFLKNRALVSAPYREIAERAQVALGTVGLVIRDLIAQGMLAEGIKGSQRKLDDFARLLDKWVDAYPHQLKEKRRIGTFTTDNVDWWKKLAPGAYGAVWGGELAAAKYTDYLNPKDAVIYIEKTDMADFLKTVRLRKVRPNETPGMVIDLIEPFWKQDKNAAIEKEGLAHPIIVYADLIATGDPRNLDAAHRLRGEYLD